MKMFRIAILLALITLLLACQLSLPGPAGPGAQPAAEQALAAYLSGEFIADEQPHYVTWVAAPANDESGPLGTQDVRGAWKCEAGVCMVVPPEEAAQMLQTESGRVWQYSYYTFAILSLNAAGDRAVIRLDQMHGPLAGLGEEIVLVKRNGQWQVESRQGLWIS